MIKRFRAARGPELAQELRWVKVAQGTSPDKLRALIGDRELPRDTLVKWELDFKIPGIARLLDLWGAEAIFRPFVPPGLELVDVCERGGKGIVDMKVSGTWLLAIVAFVKAHWLAIVIGGFLITLAVRLITMFIQIIEQVFPWVLLVVGGVLLFSFLRPEPTRKREG